MWDYTGKRAVITGASGYIGSQLVRTLSSMDCRLSLVSRGKTVPVPSGIAQVSSVQGDVTDPRLWRALVRDTDVIFHLAAHESKSFEPEEDVRVNALSTLYMAEACRLERASPGLVFASSSNLVGLATTTPVDETAPDDPLTVYGVHKLAAEKYLHMYWREFGIPSITLRLANVYGPSTGLAVSLRSGLNQMIHQAVSESSVHLFNNSERIRDFIFIDDVIDAFAAAGGARSQASATYVVGSGVGSSFLDVAKLVVASLASTDGRRVRIDVDHAAAVSLIEQRDFIANSDKFKRLTDWTPSVSLEEGITRTVAAFRDVKFTGIGSGPAEG